MISQELIYDEEFNSLSSGAQNLFLRMLCVADDCGVVPASTYTLLTLTNPPHDVKKRCGEYLSRIVEAGLGRLVQYEGKEYFLFKAESYRRHQSYTINKRTKSEYLKISAEQFDLTDFAPCGEHVDCICGADDIESRKQKAESSKQKDNSIEGKKSAARPESAGDVVRYMETIGLDAAEARAWWDHYESVGWVIGRSRTPMKDWQAACRNWKRNKEKFDGIQGQHSNGNDGSSKGQGSVRKNYQFDPSKYPTFKKAGP